MPDPTTTRRLATTLLGASLLVGCTAALGGNPYGEEDAEQKRDRKTEATTKGADVRVDTEGTASAVNDVGARATPIGNEAAATSVVDAGASPAPTGSATTSPPPSPPSCAPQKGMACEDCCVAKIPGGPAVAKTMDDVYDDCVFVEGCFTSDCEDFCADQASRQGCAGSNGSICDQIDACITRSACY